MIWSIDMELDELVVELKSSECMPGNERREGGEKDKQVVADLVKKLLVCVVTSSFVHDTKQFLCRLPELFNRVLVEKGSIVAWFSLPVLVSTNRIGTSARSERGRVFC